MAGDVELALQQILVNQGAMDLAAAKRHLGALAKAGRYQRDVY
jgi:sulfite reductase alpha subunit-like flavoprotein